jgi:hypothetical protein
MMMAITMATMTTATIVVVARTLRRRCFCSSSRIFCLRVCDSYWHPLSSSMSSRVLKEKAPNQ